MSFESVRAASIKDVNPRTDLEAGWTKPNLLRKLLNLPETKAQKTLSATVSLLQLQRLCGGGSSSPTRVMVVNRSGTKNDLCGSTEERPRLGRCQSSSTLRCERGRAGSERLEPPPSLQAPRSTALAAPGLTRQPARGVCLAAAAHFIRVPPIRLRRMTPSS